MKLLSNEVVSELITCPCYHEGYMCIALFSQGRIFEVYATGRPSPSSCRTANENVVDVHGLKSASNGLLLIFDRLFLDA